MSLTFTVMAEGKYKFFQCLGLQFTNSIDSCLIGEFESPVMIYRNGKLLDQGMFTVSPEDSSDWIFRGFSNESVTHGQGSWACFSPSDLEVGDKVVVPCGAVRHFRHYMFAEFLQSTPAWREKLALELPYPDDWQSSLRQVRAIYSEKLKRTKQALRSGELSPRLVRSQRPVYPPGRMDITIEVGEVAGQRVFVVDGVSFPVLPQLLFMWLAADDRRDGAFSVQFMVRSGDIETTFEVSWFGTHCASVIFNSWDANARQYFGGGVGARHLCAKFFQVGDRMIVTSPYQVNFLKELFMYSTDASELYVLADYERYKSIGYSLAHKDNDLRFYFMFKLQLAKEEVFESGVVDSINFKNL